MEGDGSGEKEQRFISSMPCRAPLLCSFILPAPILTTAHSASAVQEVDRVLNRCVVEGEEEG